ncbi:MAG: hypothetical protein ACI97B_001193 [Verrucomicrobiales bacterium]|jgi:uncharacterized protein (TIGR03663 family)
MNDLSPTRPNEIFATWLLISAIAIAAFAFRGEQLDSKPLHTDEAVQAMKFGELLEEHHYTYDPVEYHGPTLYYLALPIAWVQSKATIAQVSITDLRMVPLIASVLIILLLLFLRGGLGEIESVMAALLTALSPIMCYYSRYFVQEMLLIAFSFGFIAFGWRFLRYGKTRWAVLTGICLGLMHATKETFILSVACLGFAVVIDAILARNIRADLRKLGWKQLPLLVGLAIVVSVVFFSSFFTNWQGPIDSVMTYANYLGKGTEGTTGHEKSWDYFLRLLSWKRLGSGRVWSEAFILGFAAIGFVYALLGRCRGDRRLWRVLALYSLGLLVAYSALAYKTPWLALSFMQPMMLLAGLGIVGTIRLLRVRALQLLCIIGVGWGFYNLAVQSWRGNFQFAADERNPYAYVHTVPDLVRLSERIHELAALHPDGKNTLIKVMADEAWPLPWYLRDLTRVGYFPEGLPEDPTAPIMIINPERDEALMTKIDDTKYTPDAKGLRPGVMLWMYIEQGLWDQWMANRRKK